MRGRASIGLPLLGLGSFVGFLGFLFFFDRILLSISNVVLISGFYFLLGSNKFVSFFLNRNKRGTLVFLTGFLAILVNRTLVGLAVQTGGLYLLFEAFIPNVVSYVKVTPLAFVLELPGIKHAVDYILKRQKNLPV
ncbi:Got1-like family member protein [Theileria equi strain WA]|uniref:Got1-like family member protein n=1 Tax=Theileria equi strain WA TaxID=1537102 RepID=L0B168_THEEQ|nr:Got1-like family member protein [Theileria equi strain WA]AFZ80981.1 Got1-like family member protein [Theileria equi strain WA]|eukprot:XP_004830647.1 Got1-like family member protein [Theileria equi strain WA]